MLPISDMETQVKSRPQRTREYILTFLAASLASTILLKIGEIQFLELIFLADLFIVFFLFTEKGLEIRIFRPFFTIGRSYAIFMLLAFCLGVVALRQDFYPPGDESVFKLPLLLTIARIIELLVDVFYMLYLASIFREDQDLCRFGMKTYYWFGIASAVYSVVTYPLNVLYGWDLGTYFDEHRMRGFYNEAGPYGVYLITLFLVTLTLRQKRWLGRFQFFVGMSLFSICLIMTKSKSAYALLPVLFLIDGFAILKGRLRWLLISSTGLLVLGAASLVNLSQFIEVYEAGTAAYQQVSNLRPHDGNYVLGRVAGAVLSPRIIAEHPLAGVGWGNYGLIRNDPQYRQGTAFAWQYDSPGLGAIDYIVDLGIPLWLYLTWVEFLPFRLLRRQKAGALLLNLAIMQPLANIFGAHLNLTYPWIVVAFALGLGFQAAASGESISTAPAALATT
jgi:hypothetical protein